MIHFIFTASLSEWGNISSYPAVTGGIRCPFRLHVTSGEGLPWASHGRTTSVPTSAAIFTVLSWPLTPIILGTANEEGKKGVSVTWRQCLHGAYISPDVILSNISQCVDRSAFVQSNMSMFGWLRSNICLLTVDTKLDLAASITHRAGGCADVDPCILGCGVGYVEVSIRVRLKRGGGAVLGQRLPPLQEKQTKQNIPLQRAVFAAEQGHLA